jgi:hypothetical protein
MYIYRLGSVTLFVLFAVVVFYSGCTNSEDFANPLDPQNLLTAGSPPGLTLKPGDGQVTVSWQLLEVEGIAKYRIYRRFTGDADATFKRVGEIDAPATKFIDTVNLINDAYDEERGQRHTYEYRIAYVDVNGVETPDPNAPPDEKGVPLRVWPTAFTSPSHPPPIPNIILGDPTDLTVKLFWDDYQFSEDFESFRVMAAIPEGDEPLQFKLLKDGVLTKEKTFYFDRGDLRDRITGFEKDKVRKIYRVIAVDQFGVEGIATVEGMSPNLPPAPPQNVRVALRRRSLFNTKYDAILSWVPNKEPDLDGYQIYATNATGGAPVPGAGLTARNRVERKRNSATIIGEDPIRVGQKLEFRQYFITAFDNTARIDGRIDESALVKAIPQR